MFIEAIILFIGLAILIKSSELSILYSVRLSKFLGISQMAIGFLLIAVITSLPELSIAVISGIQGEGLISIGNLMGSNIVNICLIFGVVSMLVTIRCARNDYKELLRSISITSVVALVMILLGKIGFLFGMFSLITFVLFFYSIYKNHYRLKTKRLTYRGLRTVAFIKTLFYTIVSIGLVLISSKFVTDAAISISQIIGISETIVGATILATGTSLPELAISITAIKRKNYSLAVGDIIGSLVTNMTLILGITAMLGPIIIDSATVFLALMLLIVNMIFLFMTSAMKCSRWQGIILIGVFFAFILAMVNYQIFFI